MIKLCSSQTLRVSMSLTLVFFLGDSAALASAFQLFEQNGAGIGDYHAGGAAEAADASTNFYNPAGLTKIKQKEFVVSAAIIPVDLKYRGTTQVNTVNNNEPVYDVTNGSTLNYVPSFHYAAPISDRFAIGVSVAAPFGMKTDYDFMSQLRYAATKTSIQTIDVTPGLAFKLNRYLSIGAGFDAEYIKGEFNQYAGLSGPSNDTTSENELSDWGYGAHFGVLLEFDENKRLGVNYRTQISHHMEGQSTFTGALANGLEGGVQVSDDLSANITLPPTLTMSYYWATQTHWAFLGTAAFTRWSVLGDFVLNNVAGLNQDFDGDNTQSVLVHEHFSDTWNLALGVHYIFNPQFMLRFGLGYDEAPVNDIYRNVQVPDQDRYVAAIGAHMQANKNLGFDLGWSHVFVKKALIDDQQVVAAENVITVGNVKAYADVIGIQATWTVA